MITPPKQYFTKDNGIFPNSTLPVLLYKNVLELSSLFPCSAVRKLFEKNNWGNNWKAGIFTYPHYHSITHEVVGVCKGSTTIQLGGEDGWYVTIEKGDVLIIPAGVAHENLIRENDVVCIGGYPNGSEYDMNYGKPGERPQTDHNIALVPIPKTDPVYGAQGGLMEIWGK